MDKNKKLLKKEKLKIQKDKEILKKEKQKVKVKEKLKKEKQKEKLKKEKQKDKGKLKKQKEKEKPKKQKDNEKLKKQKRKIRKKKYKGGVVTTRQEKKYIQQILSTWQREDDADDYFEMWKKHSYKNNTNIFDILNYNLLTELQKIKYLIYDGKLISPHCSFEDIMIKIKSFSFLSLLAETINEEQGLDDNEKKLYFVKILKNVIQTYILLTNNLFNTTIFPNIEDSISNFKKPIFLYRSWRDNSQLESMTGLSKIYVGQPTYVGQRTQKRKREQELGKEEWGGEDILITDNYLSTSLDRNLALKFYKDSSHPNSKAFILWKIEIPPDYPYLYVSAELSEVLLHIGSKLTFISKSAMNTTIGGREFCVTEHTYKYLGRDADMINKIIKQFNTDLEILSRTSENPHDLSSKKRKIFD